MKVTVGRPRPDLIARCLPKPGSENASVFGLVTAEICTQTDNFILKDGFRSFPSAHASCTPTPRSICNQSSDIGLALVSFAGLGFLSFYLAGKIHLFVHLSRPLFYSTSQTNFSLAGHTRPHIQGFGSSNTIYRRSPHRHLAHDGLQAPLGGRHYRRISRNGTRLLRLPPILPAAVKCDEPPAVQSPSPPQKGAARRCQRGPRERSACAPLGLERDGLGRGSSRAHSVLLTFPTRADRYHEQRGRGDCILRFPPQTYPSGGRGRSG